MSFLTTTSRVLRNTFQHLARNPSHTLAAILTMSLTFFVIGIFTLVTVGSNQLIKYLEARPQVMAFFKDEAGDEHILQLKAQLEQSGKVSQVSYITKEQALNIYKQQNINEPQLLEFVTADILPASIEVSTTNLSDLLEVAQILQKDSLVEKVIYQKDVVENLRAWAQKARQIGVGLIAILILVSTLTVLIVISSNLASFGKEIEIMKLVGASSWYVRWPFLLDGVIFGIVSGSVAAGLLFLLLPSIKAWSAGFILGVEIFPDAHQLITNIWLGTTLAGIALGVFGSLIAIWKHLRV